MRYKKIFTQTKPIKTTLQKITPWIIVLLLATFLVFNDDSPDDIVYTEKDEVVSYQEGVPEKTTLSGNAVVTSETPESVDQGTTARTYGQSEEEVISLILKILELREEKDIIEKADLIVEIDRSIKYNFNDKVYQLWLDLTDVMLGNKVSDDVYIELLFEMTSGRESSSFMFIHNILRLHKEEDMMKKNGLTYAEVIDSTKDQIRNMENSALEQAWLAFLIRDEKNPDDYFKMIELAFG